MIDLHLHLDGSLSVDDFKYLSDRNHISLGDDFPNNIYVPNDCKSLEEYLTRFDLPCSLLQDEFSIAYAVSSLINRLYKKGYIYAEIRFAPCLHTLKGLSQEEVVISAISGLNHALKNIEGFDANLILCCMRQYPLEINMETIKIADKYRSKKVVSVDLAGPELLHTADYYAPIYLEAYRRNLNIIIHAGEAGDSLEIIRAVNELHATRIGHGVHLDLSRENIRLLAEKRITFEFCPTSNLQTTSLPDYKSVPIKEFERFGIPVCINSDNMTVSGTDVLEEFRHLYREFNLQKHEVRHFLINSINASFADLGTKSTLISELNKKIDNFYELIIKK